MPRAARGRELRRKLDRREQASGIGASGAREVERRPMVDRRAHDRQAERHVDARAEARVLQHRQALIVIHREHRVGVAQAVRMKQRIGRQRTDHVVTSHA